MSPAPSHPKPEKRGGLTTNWSSGVVDGEHGGPQGAWFKKS